jgi:hypothetical protein
LSICQLCHNDHELRNSHIVPEFLYGDLYNDKGHLMGINGRGNRGWKALQNGIREYLFCESCEQYFNEYFEKPFRAQWVVAAPLPNPWNDIDVHWVKMDYSSFKLFHLSVLFRASVSSLPTYAEISLGPHEETLRQLLLNRDPGAHTQYPVFGYAVVHHQTRRLIPMVSQGQRSSFGGHRCYGMMYGGVEWWVSVSSHRNLEFEQIALQPDGRMPFHSVPWNEVSVIQSASKALRDARR